MIVDKKTYTVKNIITTRDTEICKEVYMTADDDKLICKDIDGENRYYLSKEEAQATCDEYNKVNQVYELVSKYKQYQICQFSIYIRKTGTSTAAVVGSKYTGGK